MNAGTFAESTIGKPFVRILAAAMESRFRYRFFNPTDILHGVDNLKGRVVLEIGCGTGFFTLPAARLIGDQGYLVAMDIVPGSVELVSQKVRKASLAHVRVIRGDAMESGLATGSFHTVLLFGVIPAPMLPLARLLPEIHRVLKPDGGVAVWPPVPGWLPRSILKSGLFIWASKRNGVHNFRRREAGTMGSCDSAEGLLCGKSLQD
jgi:ubiquinone/menaquinone biosynthesis C-methylase UbiE